MSRAQGIWGFSATQTCNPGIQTSWDLHQRKLTGYLNPELGTHGLRCEQVRLFGKPPRTALFAIEHQP